LVVKRGYCCEICGKTVNEFNSQLAHIVPKTKYNLKKYGEKLIHNPKNIKVVCGLRCNAKVLIGIDQEAEKILMGEIKGLFS
jgi:5-methylcytosine-specific restriction endonuclease McrA